MVERNTQIVFSFSLKKIQKKEKEYKCNYSLYGHYDKTMLYLKTVKYIETSRLYDHQKVLQGGPWAAVVFWIRLGAFSPR